MKLINGRGQLGAELLKKIDNGIDCTIYHTWDITDQTEKTQEECFNEFINYVLTHTNEKIIFVSTLHEKYGMYLHYKINAEIYLLEHTKTGKVMRIPHLIGKGLCKRMKSGLPIRAGNIEIASPADMANRIIENIDNPERLIFLHGHIMDAILARDLVLYGSSND